MEKQRIYFAPMEGVTGYVYRNVHHHFFGGVNRYFTPFVVANQTLKFKTREKKDVAPENNTGLEIVPQIMANKAKEFLWAAGALQDMGYEEVNLNLGCPASTVVSKKKGAGFLAWPDELNAFLEEIFPVMEARKMHLSIKTRLGKERLEEADRLIEIYNQYPVSELIIHPRVQKEFYKNCPHRDVFATMAKQSRARVCYNGNLFTRQDQKLFQEQFPEIDAVMLGRGLIANPALAREISGGEPLGEAELYAFQKTLWEAYGQTDLGEINTLFKMKELWAYMGCLFADGDRYLKKLRKAKNREAYDSAVSQLFSSCRITGAYKG